MRKSVMVAALAGIALLAVTGNVQAFGRHCRGHGHGHGGCQQQFYGGCQQQGGIQYGSGGCPGCTPSAVGVQPNEGSIQGQPVQTGGVVQPPLTVPGTGSNYGGQPQTVQPGSVWIADEKGILRPAPAGFQPPGNPNKP
jgi:hypothetical protein